MTADAMKKCPYCAEEIRAEAIKCRYCGSLIGAGPLPGAVTRAWYRSRNEKMIAGVCMGLANQFNVSVTLIRLAFILGTIFGGWGVIIYVTLWFIMPKEPVMLPGESHRDKRQGSGVRDQGSGQPSYRGDS